MHADTTLTLGAEGGADRDPDVTVEYSYEGLEAGTVNVYGGRYHVYAVDDGINAAGGSSNGSDPGGNDPFNPGGGFNPWQTDTSDDSGDYALNIYGGNVYVDCLGDGLDSNGTLSLTGGNITVLSMASGGDNSSIDADGTVTINGATVFTAGTTGMDGSASSSWFGSGQGYVTSGSGSGGGSPWGGSPGGSSTTYSAGQIINVRNSSTVIYSEKLVRNVNYLMYSSPDYSSGNLSFATASSLTACKSNSWAHSWDSGSTSGSTVTYTCSSCGAAETQTIASSNSYVCAGHEAEQSAEEEEDEGFTITFDTDEGVASIDIYYTQDYTAADETGVSSAVSRDSSTGEPDSTGNGQLNFLVNLNEGYTVSSVTATAGTYKNLKGESDTGVANLYRMTKITADSTVTITTVQCSHENVSNPVWTWSDDYSTATLTVDCSDCGSSVSYTGTVSSVLTDESTITFTASATAGETEYTDTQTAAPYTITFDVSDGASVNIYYTQDTETASETNVTSGVARDSDTGYPVISGDGQINFTIVIADGYTYEGLTKSEISGGYKNLKDNSTDDLPYTYRITKITGDVTITITPEQSHTHSLTHYDAVDATCEETGNIEYWYCEECGTYFSDEEAATEISLSDITIEAIGHAWGEWTVITEATEEEEGEEQRVCSNDSSHVQTRSIPVIGHEHVLTLVEEKAASCEESGNTEYYVCEDCGRYFADAEWVTEINEEDWYIAPAGHTLTHYEAVSATCEETGSIEYWLCSVCGKYFSDEGVTEIAESDTVIEALGHDYGEWEAYNDDQHMRECANDSSHVEYADHEWDDGELTTAPTKTADGVYTYTCSVCEASKTETVAYIPATGIELSETDAEIATKATLQLTATITPENATDQTVTWTSSNAAIAKVDSTGLVTAKKYGTAVITATTADGASASCEIQTRFYDVNNSSKSYYNAVYWAVDNGITKCTVAFSPEDGVTRGEFVAFLYRMAGSPKVTKYATKFSDVNSSTKFYKEISWAVSNNIIQGFSSGKFKPEAGVTRAQAAIMLWRWAGRPSVSVKTSPFSDVKAANSDTCKAIIWGNKNGIIKGYSDGTFRPKNACTRANVVTFLYRYSLKFNA